MRIAFKNGKGEAIDHLSQEFMLTIDASELTSVTEHECAASTVNVMHAEKATDTTIAFKQWDDLEFAELEVLSAFKVASDLILEDGTIKEDKCPVKYQLQIYDQGSEEYIPLGDFAELLKATEYAAGELLSKIEIDEWTGDVRAFIANHEFEAFKDDFFLDSRRRLSQSATQYAIKLRLVPAILGSETHGPGQTDIYHDFKIKLVDSSAVKSCAQNKLTVKELTVLGSEERDPYLTYSIMPTGTTVFPQRIKALSIHRAIEACETETVAEYYNPMSSKWEPFRKNEWIDTNFDISAMYIDFSANQEHYIKHIAKMFAFWESGYDLPQMVYIEIRFRTFDISAPEEIFAMDNIVLEVLSNNEKPSSFCDFSQLLIDPNTRMSGQRAYTISNESGHIHSQQIPILTDIDGWEYVQQQEGCFEMLWMSLEFEHPSSGRWEELQWEELQSREPMDTWMHLAGSMNSRIYFKRDYDTSFSTLYVEIDANDYLKYLTLTFGSGEYIDIPLRIMYYDNERIPIEALSSYFSVKVMYQGENACEEVAIYKNNQGPSKHYLSFAGQEGEEEWTDMNTSEPRNELRVSAMRRSRTAGDASHMPEDMNMESGYIAYPGKFASLEIEHALTIKRENETYTEQCEFQYRLLCRDFESNEWKLWTDFAAELAEESVNELTSYVYADQYNGYFSMSLNHADVQEFKYRFTEGEHIYMHFKLVAMVPGSVISGPDTPLEELPSADFKVFIVDDQQADMCASNTIAVSPKTYTDVQRDDVVEFQIASMLEEQQLFILEALKVQKTVPECDTNTILEYKNMNCNEEDSDEYGHCWEPVRESEQLQLFLSEEEGMKAVFNLTQKDYLNMVDSMTQGQDGGEVTIMTRFATHDPTTQKTKYDYVKVRVLSSMETRADFCAADIAALSISENTAMTLKRNYLVGPSDKEPVRLPMYITTEIEGFEFVDNHECLEGLYTTLDVMNKNQKFETLWHEREGIIHEMGDTLYIEEVAGVDYIVAQLSHQQYVDRLQTAYDTLEPSIDITIRIARRGIDGAIIDDLTSQFVLNVTDNGEVSKCTDKQPTLNAATGDWQVSFNSTVAAGMVNKKKIEIKKTVEAKVDGAENLDCGISYKLLVKDGDNWIYWDDLAEILIAENPNFDSYVHFNPSNGDFMAEFSETDYEAHKDRFTDANTSKVEMKFKGVPIVPGSSVAGPTTPLDTLVGAEFKITFVEPTEAAKCENVQMSLADTYNGVDIRSDMNTFTIGTSSALTINAKKIYSSADCPTVTVLEFKTQWGEWMEIRNGHEGFVVDTTAEIKKIDFNVDQPMFLDYLQWQYGEEHLSTDVNVDSITIECRFRHQTPNGKEITDPFKIKVESSGESDAALCASEFSGLSMAEQFVATERKYQIKEKDNELKNIYVPAKYTGYESLTSRCKPQLKRTLDYLSGDGITWRTAFTEGDEIPEISENGIFYLEKENDVAWNIKVMITHKHFVDNVQTEYNSIQKEITASVRLAVRDGDDAVIPALTSQFDIKMIDIEEVSECANIRAFFKSSTRNHIVAFDSELDGQQIYIERALEASYGFNEAWDTNVECEMIYQLQVFDKNTTPPGYVNLDIFMETLSTEWGRKVQSVLEFNRHEASISGFLSNTDFNDNLDRFTYADNTVALKLRVLTMILESTVAGPATDKATLPSVEFSFELVAATAANTCKDNKLSLRETLPDGTERVSDTFEYQIAKMNAGDTEMIIKGNQVRSSAEAAGVTCLTETVIEYKKMVWNMTADGTNYTEEIWSEIKQTEGMINLDIANMQFGVTFSQDDFLEDIRHEFETTMSPISEIEESAIVQVRFRTIDVASKSEVSDYVMIKILSSGENEAQRCDFSGLTVTSQMPSPAIFVYNIAKSTEPVLVKEIYAPIMISGLDDPSIISKRCASQVHMSLDFKTLSERWQNIWTPQEPRHESIEVFDSYAIWYLDVNQTDFTEGIAREFQLANDATTVTIDMRFVYRDGSGHALAGTDNEFKVTINNSHQVINACADAEVQFKTKSRDIPLAFNATNGDYDYQHIDIPKALATEFTDTTLDCKVFYRLQAEWAGNYMDWDDVVLEIESTLAGQDIALSSYVSFNVETGDINAGFSFRDFNALQTEFTANGVTAIKFKVFVVIPGSTTQGTDATLGDLVSAEFQITYIEPSVVNACEGNTLIKTPELLSGEDRDYTEYDIPKNQQAGDGITIEAYTVRSTNTDCQVPTFTIAQWWNPMMNEYVEIREGDKHVTITAATVDSGMTINFNPTQQFYLEDLVNTFAYGHDASIAGTNEENHKAHVKSIEIQGRFVTIDPATMQEVYDKWYMVINSSTETENDFCPWSDYLSKDPNGTAMKDRKYTVGPRSEADFRESFFITEKVIGLPELKAAKPKCAEILKQTFDMQLPDGTWRELWNHWETHWVKDHEEQYGPLSEDYFHWKQFYIMEADPGYYLYVQFSQETFESEFQIDFETLNNVIEIPVRLNTRDGSGKPIEALTIAFNINVTREAEDASECLEHEVMFESKIRDLALAIPQNNTYDWEQWAYVYEKHALAVKNITEDTTVNCTVVYRLFVMDEGEYKPWDRFVTALNEELAPESLSGSIWFDKFSADISASFSESDIERFRTRFGGEVNLRVYAVVAGSQVMGPLNNLDDLVYSDFKITLIANDLVAECEKNSFINTFASKDLDQRDTTNTFRYQVAKTGEEVEAVTIKAFDILQTKKDCRMKTVFEYWNPSDYYSEYNNEYYGNWVQARENEFIVELNLDKTEHYAGIYFKFQTDQVGFMEKLVPMFEPYSDPLNMPKSIWIQARFRTFDEATKMEIVDEFWLEIMGSDEDLTDFCNYESLSIKAGTYMSGVRTIDIVADEDNDWKPKEIFISTEIEGLHEFRMYNQNCASVITMSVEAKLPSLSYEEIWNSQSGSMMQWLWVEQRDNDVNWIMVQISRWNFVNELQWKFETIKTKFTIPMRVVWRDGKGEPIFEEGFSIELNDVSQQEQPCKDKFVNKKAETRDFLFAVDSWKYMSADGMYHEEYLHQERQQMYIENTLDLEWDHATSSQECYPKYKLYIKGAFNDEWQLWSERQTELRREGFNGTLYFNEWGTSVELDFSVEDVEMLRSLYATDATIDEAFLMFKTIAGIPGSEAMGPATPVDELTHAIWRLKLISGNKSMTCADSKLYKSDLTVDGTWRDYYLSYQVLPAGTAPEPWVIPAMKVVPTVKGCPFETIVKYETREGWMELKQNDYVTLNLDPETMTVSMVVNQELYLDKLMPAFGSGAAGYIDDFVVINIQVWSKDTNGNEVLDEFSIEIRGSDDDFSSVCNWAILSIAETNMMADEWEYTIAESGKNPVYKDILVTTLLEGIEQLSDECQEQIYMSLDVKITEDVWLEIWSNNKQNPMETVADVVDKVDEYMPGAADMYNDYMNNAGSTTDMYNDANKYDQYMNAGSTTDMYNDYMNAGSTTDMYNDANKYDYMNNAGSTTDMYNDYMNSGSTDKYDDYMNSSNADKYDQYMSGSDPNMYSDQAAAYMPTDKYNDTTSDMNMDYDKYQTEIYDEHYNISPVRIEERDGGFHYMVMEMSQDFFVNTVQFELGTTEPTVEADFRIAFKNAYGEPITFEKDVNGVPTEVEMIDDFTVTIYGNDEDTGCADVTAELYESARAEYTLAFNETDMIQMKEFHVDQALVAKLSDPTKDCAIKYKLTCYDKETTSWRLWDDFVKELETLAGGKLSSEVNFNPDYGNLFARFSNFDVEALKARFTNDQTNEVAIEYRIAAYVAGSTTMGYDAADTALIKQEIKFKMLEQQTITDCGLNTLIKTDLTVADQFRELIEYTIPTGGNFGADFEIPAKYVKSSVQNCPTTTVVEFMDASGYWCEQRDTADNSIVLDMENDKKATFKFNQQWFLETGLEKYQGFDPTMATNAADIPEKIYIIGRFKTIDETTGVEIIDEFEIAINSSLETPTDLCNTAFATLDFEDGTAMTAARTYDVTDENMVKSIYIPTTLTGLDTIGACKNQISMTLDYKLPSGLYKTAWSQKYS